MSDHEPPPGSDPGWEPAWDTEPQPSAEAPRTRPRSHRAPNQFTARLLAPLTAVGVVILVIVLLIWINGHPTGGTTSAAVVGPHSPSAPSLTPATTPLVPPTSSPASPSTAASPTTTTSAPASPPPSNLLSSPPVAHPHKTKHAAPPASTAMATVQVLNNSRIHGLAHGVAADIAAKGWHVGIIGNLQGEISESTVYYAPGEKAAAQHLAREFASIRRVEPNIDARLTSAGITLVITADWES